MTHSARQTAADVEVVEREREIVERKSTSWQVMEIFPEVTNFYVECGSLSTLKRACMGREDVAPRRSMRILIAMPQHHRGQKKAKLTLFFF